MFPDVSRKRFPDNHPRSTKNLLSSDNLYLKSDAEDAERTLRWLDFCKEDKATAAERMTQAGELQWMGEGIPSAWYACDVLAKENGIKAISKGATWSTYDQRWYTCVAAKKGHGKLASVRAGASQWKAKNVAICFAMRNAVRALLPQEAKAVGWRGTKRAARSKYA